MNQQNTMAATAAANLVHGIATKLYGDAGAGITDLIALNNLVSRQSAELAPSNPLLAVARRNIRQFLAKASFASEVDRFAAGQCLDVMDAALAARQTDTALASIYELLGVRNESDAGAEIARLHIAARQPVEPVLWCMHILGPDDVYPAPTKEHAELAAKALNAFHAARSSNSIFEPTMEAVVAPWPHSAESHAADVAKFIPEWIIPASQLRTETKIVAPPAQPVDLGQPLHGICLIKIPARNNLDPIDVFVQDYELGRGRIVVTCYGQAWCGFWGAMGDRTVMHFVASCNADYVAGNMLSGRHEFTSDDERTYVVRIATEVVTEFRALINGQAVRIG